MKLWIAKDRNGFIRLYRQKPILVWVNRFREDWDGDFMGLLNKVVFQK